MIPDTLLIACLTPAVLLICRAMILSVTASRQWVTPGPRTRTGPQMILDARIVFRASLVITAMTLAMMGIIGSYTNDETSLTQALSAAGISLVTGAVLCAPWLWIETKLGYLSWSFLQHHE